MTCRVGIERRRNWIDNDAKRPTRWGAMYEVEVCWIAFLAVVAYEDHGWFSDRCNLVNSAARRRQFGDRIVFRRLLQDAAELD